MVLRWSFSWLKMEEKRERDGEMGALQAMAFFPVRQMIFFGIAFSFRSYSIFFREEDLQGFS